MTNHPGGVGKPSALVDRQWAQLAAAGFDPAVAPVGYLDFQYTMHTTSTCPRVSGPHPSRVCLSTARTTDMGLNCLSCRANRVDRIHGEVVRLLAEALELVQAAEAHARSRRPRARRARVDDAGRAWVRTRELSGDIADLRPEPTTGPLVEAAHAFADALAGRAEDCRARIADHRPRWRPRARDRHLVWVPLRALCRDPRATGETLRPLERILTGQVLVDDPTHAAVVMSVRAPLLTGKDRLPARVLDLGPARPGEPTREWATMLTALLADTLEPADALTAARAVTS